jgi:tRNA G18 (ribose-2'-O)-methylase SpoU
MPVIPITDAGDPRIADYRNVSDPELLRRRRLFVAENRLVVRALVTSARFRTRSVLVTDAAFGSLQHVLAPLEPVLPVYVCPKSLMEPVSGYHIHRGCLALGERPAPVTVADLLAALDARREQAEWGVGAPRATEPGGVQGAPPLKRSLVVLEAITNADNVGAIFRNARAFGVEGIVMGPRCCDPLYRKAIRVSIGATLVVPFATVEGVGTQSLDYESVTQFRNQGIESRPPFLLALKRAGFTLVALTPAADAVDLTRFAAAPLPDRIALVVGNEGEGLSAAAQEACDVRVRIAMAPGVDSLNASTATGIALHRIFPTGPSRPEGRNLRT